MPTLSFLPQPRAHLTYDEPHQAHDTPTITACTCGTLS